MWTKALRRYGTETFHSDRDVRLRKVGDSILSALRAEKLPVEVETELMIQYQQYKRYAEQIQKHAKESYAAHEHIGRVINKILTAGGLIDFVSGGRKGKDYIAIMDGAEKLLRSELVYQQKRLERMAIGT